MEFLKKILTIIICLQIGFSNSVMQEVLSLPSLVEHYFQHSEKQNIGIIEFVELHYTENEGQNQQNPDHHHDSLPLHHQNISIASYIFCIPDLVRSEKEKNIVSESEIKTFEYSFSAKETVLKSFWHPPKLA